MAVKPLTEALARQFGLKTTRKGGPQYVLPPDPTPAAMETARRNAAKPVEEGGLGLPADNTNVDRARAMGYGIPFYHGTMDKLTRVEPFRNKAGFFGANEPPEVAETYAFEPFAPGLTNLSESKVYTLLMRDDALAKVKDPDNPAKVGQVDWGGQNFDRAEGALLDLPNGDQIELDVIDTDDLEDIAEQYGLDAIEISNIKDVTSTGFGGIDGGKGTFDLIEEGGVPREMPITKFPVSEDEFGILGAVAEGTESVAYKPGLVRAPNAAFDPAQRGSSSLTASVDPITAGGILSLIASGGKEALDYVQQNLDPRTIADYGLAITAMTPTPLALPALATESALLASDVVNALRDPETRQQIQDFVTKEGVPSTSGQMKRAVNYQNGGPVDPQDDLFPETIKEGIGTLIEYVPKAAKFLGRGVGDLVRSEPASPPEYAVDRPVELTQFQMDTETLLPEELDMISDNVIGKLYSDDVVQRLEDPEERAGLFLYADKPGVTDAPPKSVLLRDTVRRSLEEQKNAFDKLRYEGQLGLREGVPLLSRSAVMKNVFNVLREQIGPEGMSRIGDDRLARLIEQSVRESTVKGMADGGVVSLKDRAVNMTRGPRSNGIMQYVPFITGATNGY